MKAIDLGGHELARKTWSDYITESISGIVYIIDAADSSKFEISKIELQKLLKKEELQNVPFLILGNKIDNQKAVSEDTLKEYFEIQTTGKEETLNKKKKEFIQRPIEIFMCSIMEEVGYGDGILWLRDQINNK